MTRKLGRNAIALIPAEDMAQDAMEYLRQNEPDEGYFVGFSGGKDSIVTLELCRRSGVKYQAFYSCTRIDPPEVVKFIRNNYPDVTWLYPKETMWSAIKRKSPPLRMSRWCCDVLKKDPANQIALRHRAMGIRAEESSRRAARPRTDYVKSHKQHIYKPIFLWTEYHVWDFIEKHNLAYPSLYDEGFDRIGCVVCPFIMGAGVNRERIREVSMQRWPGMWRAFESACKAWFDPKKVNVSVSDRRFTDFKDYYASYLLGFEDNKGCKDVSTLDQNFIDFA